MPGSISEENESLPTIAVVTDKLQTPSSDDSCSPTISLKHKDAARGSISSVDSSISLSYDAAPFTPRGSLTDVDNNTSIVMTDESNDDRDVIIITTKNNNNNNNNDDDDNNDNDNDDKARTTDNDDNNNKNKNDGTESFYSLDESNSSGTESAIRQQHHQHTIKRVFINDAVVRAARESAKSCFVDGSNSSSSSGGCHSSSNSNSKRAIVDNNNSSEEDGYEEPDPELVRKIADQVEYYFSDENIVKDAFLLKHVRRNKEGYVSLKLIASFKRVKHIAKDWRAVRDALRKGSSKLEINESGTKLRRLDPLPLYDQTTPSRTVVAINIPPEKATIESIAEMFRSCGEIALVRVLRPGNPIPADVRPFYNKHPEMHGVVSGLIEFVRTESAHNAMNRTTDTTTSTTTTSTTAAVAADGGTDIQQMIQVLELNAPASSTSRKRSTVVNSNANNSGNNNNNSRGSGKYYHNNNGHYHHYHHNRLLMDSSEFSSSCQSGSESEDVRFSRHHQYHPSRLQRRYSSGGDSESPTADHQQAPVLVWNPPRRWSRDSGSDSPGSNFSRSRSNSGVYYPPPALEQQQTVRRMSAGWESGSDSYGSCRSRSNSGASIPDVFAMRRYSLPRKDSSAASECCCCNNNNNNNNSAKCDTSSPIIAHNNNNIQQPPSNGHHNGGSAVNGNGGSCNNNNPNGGGGRRYSFGKTNDFAAFNGVRRCSNDYTMHPPQEQQYRQSASNTNVEYYCPPQHRNSINNGAPVNGGPFERRSSFGKIADGCAVPVNWTRGNSSGGGHAPPMVADGVRRLSDSDGRLLAAGGSCIRQRSFGNGPGGHGSETIIRLPRGPDGGRGFQRDLSEFAVPE